MTDFDTPRWRGSLRRHDVMVFMLVALILTWEVWLPRAMGFQVGVVGQLWTWIPAVAARGVQRGGDSAKNLAGADTLRRLLIRYPAVAASLILGLYGLWHLPPVLTAASVLEGQPLWLLLTDLLVKSLIFTYVFLGTQGSVLIAILLHASTNLFAVSPTTGPDGDLGVPLVALVLKVVLAAALFVHLPRSFDDGRAVGHLLVSAAERGD
jgi:hypothetical protein